MIKTCVWISVEQPGNQVDDVQNWKEEKPKPNKDEDLFIQQIDPVKLIELNIV